MFVTILHISTPIGSYFIMKIQRIASNFSIHTTQGRVLTLSSSFLLVFILFACFVYYQNQRTQEVSQTTIDVRLPIALSAANVLSNIEAAATAQLSFIVTKDKKYVEQRKQIWSDRIEPHLAKLDQLKSSLTSENQHKIDSLTTWIKAYRQAQDEENDLTLQLQSLDATDSSFVEAQQATNDALAILIPRISAYYINIEQELSSLTASQQEQLQTDISGILTSINSTNSAITMLCVIIVVLSILIGYYASRKANSAIARTTEQIQLLAKGEITASIDEVKGDLNVIVRAGNQLKDNLQQAVSFALEVGEGKFDNHYQPVSEHDALGNALISMRDKLQQSSEEDKRRNWTSEGLARFSEILRSNVNFTELASTVITHLVKYTGANQGGLFIIQNEGSESVLELAACYAYERRKYLNKRIQIGEGLVGQCYLEGETIYLTALPEDYINITSGLGTAPPTSVLIVPLKINDDIEGIVELASFRKFLPHEIAFIEKLGETIASTLSSAKLTQKTQRLLEETRQQAEMLRSQEEEMRQNMEELMATQEEMERKTREMQELNASY